MCPLRDLLDTIELSHFLLSKYGAQLSARSRRKPSYSKDCVPSCTSYIYIYGFRFVAIMLENRLDNLWLPVIVLYEKWVVPEELR